MALKQDNKVDPNFNMSSMTDMIFLLLIFFMLTSNFVTPSGLPIEQPTSKAASKVMPKITVGITKDGQYYINENKLPLDFIQDELASLLQGEEEGTVVITIDKDAPTQYLINVAGIAAKLKAKTVISVKPE
ncbi:MAG: biopolymer transport protein ExbD [Arenicella sp.]|jgi:biopolymer transport protein ExbD